jgi:outer membrane protein insertion porin family
MAVIRLYLLLLLCAPLTLLAQIQDVSDKRVKRIDIIVERATGEVDATSIRNQLKTKVGEPFSQLDFDEDLKTLSAEYDRVEPKIEPEDGQVAITLRLWPRPTLRSIEWQGNDHISDRKLVKELGISPGTTFDRAAFNKAFHKLQDLYIKKGFFQAELSYRVEQLPDENGVNVIVSVHEGKSGRIKKIVFQGLSKKEQSDLLELVRSKKYFFLTSWMTHAGTYHQEMVDQDRYVVLNYLQNQGYADAKVNLEVLDKPRGDGIILVFRVDRGRPYTFGRISFDGNTLFEDEQIAKQMKVRRGDPYSPEALRDAQKRLTDLYGSKGYIEALITYEPHLVPGVESYNVDFNIEEGEKFRVGVVKVFGTQRTQQDVLRNEMRFTPGEVFDIGKLQATEQYLRNMDYFETVNVYSIRPSDDPLLGPGYRDIYVEVEEKATGSFGLNFGYSSLENVFAGIEITERNFNINGLQCLFQEGPGVLRGGGELAQAKLNLGRKQTSVQLNWAKPYFMNTCWVVSLQLDRSINKRVSDAYTLRSTSFNAMATYPVNQFLSYGVHYRLSYTDTDLRKDPKEVAKLLERQGQNQGAISAVGVNFLYNSVDYRHTRGFRSNLSAEYAGVYGTYYFARFGYENTLYISLRDFACLKLYGDLRFVQPLMHHRNDIPLTERLMLGGESTMRGFANYAVGPVYAGSLDPRGGFSSLLLTAEVNKVFFEQLQGFLFTDGGYVSYSPWTFKHLEWSVGFGCRLNLMGQMPMTFGWGFPLNPRRKNEIQRFFFAMGGRF